MKIVKKLLKQIKNNGHLVIGLSENLPPIDDLQYLGNSVYQKKCHPSVDLKKKKILFIDDSKTMSKIIEKSLSSSPKYEVIAHAENTVQAEEYIKTYSPDLITLDIQMPGEDGDDFYKRFINKMKIPTIVMTSLNVKESQKILDLLEMGGSDYIQKPNNNEFIHLRTQLEEKFDVAINYKNKSGAQSNKVICDIKPDKIKNNIIAIGSSTGGTVALASMLPSFPRVFPPTVIVQHIPKEFSGPFANRINTLCPFSVVEAQDGDKLNNSTVYIAPGNKQLGIESVKCAFVIRISDDPPVNRHAPSVDYFFKSIGLLKNLKITALILTGMGKDGAAEMLNLKKMGHLTLVQDEKSSAVYGMPKSAKEIGAATEEVSLDKMTERIFKDFI